MFKEYSISAFQPGADKPDIIAGLHLDVRLWQRESGQNEFAGRILDSQADLKAIEAYYIKPGGNFFIAKDNKGNVIGFIGLKNDGHGEGSLKRLAVVPEWQRRGVGRALVSMAMDWAKRAGFARLSLQTHSREYAKPLYEKFGFKVTAWLEERGDWIMECKLEA
ncbi:MAG TPA: GNAT family N-acetyltransferase [Candidatus Saccharimonadales bacterium]|nr:GNAT family N-acetyltransferase [Candidatus Saccharimonadales bacterium]